MRPTIRLAALGLALFAGLAHAATAPAPLTAETIWEMKRLGAPVLSPDGRFAVLTVTQFDVKENKSATDLWLVPTAGGAARRLTSDNATDAEPAWSPDGTRIAFVSRRGDDKQSQLYVIRLDGGEAQRVTTLPTGASGPKWFGDSKRIAFISRVWADLKTFDEQAQRLKEREDSKVNALAWSKAPIQYWDHWLDDRQSQVYWVSAEGGPVTAITLGSGYELSKQTADRDAYDISPDGTEIAFAADVDRTGTDSNYDVFVMPVAGGPARNLTAGNKADDRSPLYSPDGRWLAFVRQVMPRFYAERERLVLHDRAADTSRVMTEDWDRDARGLVWLPDSKALYGSIEDAGTIRLYRFDIKGGKPVAITHSPSIGEVDVAGKPNVVVGLRQSLGEPPTLVRVSPRDGAMTQLSTFNDAILSGAAIGRSESVTYKGADGDDIQMWVTYPPGFDPSKKYPVFLLLHGGPHNGISDSWTFRWNSQVFAGWGYVVAWHNFHGSSGFGEKFTDSINPDRISKPYEDTIKAAEWFAAQPWTDTSRMVAGGGSYGGFLAATLLGRPHPFKALIAHAAVYNEYTQYGSDYGADKRRHFEHWDKPEEFLRYSPHASAGNFVTPTLVLHGQVDYRVPLNNGVELFNTLQNRGVPSRFVYFKDENHWVLKPQNSLYWYREVKDWVTHYAPPNP
ncbi:MAG: S9 family peptidase [Gammaproteobacteria bacterium]|nr:S9 family peptidase [Gammaproteobacteria bacterium]